MKEYERKRMSRIVSAIDKRAAIFECDENSSYFSEKVPYLLGIEEKQWEMLKNNMQSFKEYLSEHTMEMKQTENTDCRHCIGIIDADERYVILHAFLEENCIYGFVTDKTEEVYGKLQKNEELEQVRLRSATDPLTGIPNREGFETAVRQALAEQPGQGILLIMDMDNFKLVNDMLGHPVGDLVLQQFATMIEDFFGEKNGIVGRIGGDEFVVFLKQSMKEAELHECLNILLATVRENFADDYPKQKLSASIGAVFVKAGTNDYDSLYKSADDALYTVKKKGKGNYHIR